MSLGRIARRQNEQAARLARQAANAQAILDGANPAQRYFIEDESDYVAGLCPRRSGKTYGVTSKALRLGEMRPGARILIVSLTLKSTVENYWSGAPGGLFSQNARYDLGLKFNTTSHTWIHPNGSRGLLAGAETKKDIEHLRGAAAEADLVIIDECKSFAPAHLADLIENVIEPGLMTRRGQLVMIGTPGSIPMGPFYQATCPLSRVDADGNQVGKDERGRPTCIHHTDKAAPGPAYKDLSDEELTELFSLHTWTIEDNLAAPWQWTRALAIKRRRNWDDNHPTWRREYLGEWVGDTSELVYYFASAKSKGMCLWKPQASKENVTGLPDEHGPWHLLLGLDLGFTDESAMVLVAYSEQLKELRHVYDYKEAGMTSDDFMEEVLAILDIYGMPETVVGDFGGGGSKMILETLNQRHGMSILAAEKLHKNEFIEMINSDFMADRIKIISGSDLDHELCGLQWDLSNDSKLRLARTGRLREDPSCPNHLCDALLYIWRWSYHYFSRPVEDGPARGTQEWEALQEQAMIDRAVARRRGMQGTDALTAKLKMFAKERPMTRDTLPPTALRNR